MKSLFLMFSLLFTVSASFGAEKATLQCAGKTIDMEQVRADDDYLTDLYNEDCGVEGKACFTGKDTQAWKLVLELNKLMYAPSDEVQIIGAYFKDGSDDTIQLKFKETGDFKVTVIERCK